MTILFVVESSGKISKISKVLGKGYLVVATGGHVEDLEKNKLSIDFDNNFEPIYVVSNTKSIAWLKSCMKKCDTLYIAADLDREGEKIADSVYKILRPRSYKRITFNAVDKTTIMKSIDNAGKINQHLVDAQKARRILDRLYGYLPSEILRRQLANSKVSAGRVQSVTTKIVVEQEEAIKNFLDKNSESTFFKVSGCFSDLKASLYTSNDKNPYSIDQEYTGKPSKILLNDSETPYQEIKDFLKKCLKSQFVVHSIVSKDTQRMPAPPFETATMQQEAYRKLRMSVKKTMAIAQKLYEAGYITYMRTDSVEISKEGHEKIKRTIEKEFGLEYYQKNVFKNKTINTQEAHEAVRPINPKIMALDDILGNTPDDVDQIKLYKLIWQRTIASQMKPAEIKITTIQIHISKYVEHEIEPFYYFNTRVEKTTFLGFLKVYEESFDDTVEEDDVVKNFSGKIPKKGNILIMKDITAKQEFLRPPPRLTEASIVGKLKRLGIGRPGTTNTIISTITQKGYVKIDNVDGIKKNVVIFSIHSDKNGKHINKIDEKKSTICIGKENKKLIPTELGFKVTNYLTENFSDMMDYKFTASMEKALDDIAEGKKVWHKVVKKYYDKLNPVYQDLQKQLGPISNNSGRLLGIDNDGNELYAIMTKKGPRVKKQIDSDFHYVEIKQPLDVDTIKLKQAIKLFKYPIIVGEYEKNKILLKKGEKNFYLLHNKEFYPLNDDVTENISLKQAICIIQAKKANTLGDFEIIEGKNKVKALVINGIHGPYIMIKRGNVKTNYRIPERFEPNKLTVQQIKEIIKNKKTYDKSIKKTKGAKKITTKN